jgi:hypothetical protein
LNGEEEQALNEMNNILIQVRNYCDPLIKEVSYYNMAQIYYSISDFQNAEKYCKLSIVNRKKYPFFFIKGKRLKLLKMIYNETGNEESIKIEKEIQEAFKVENELKWYYERLTYDVGDLCFWD